MRFYNRKQNPILAIVLIFELFVTTAFPASAGLFGGGPSIPSTSSMLSEMEQRYHLNPEALQNQGEMMNVSGSKGSAPEVSLSFSPSDPKAGQKISAKAFPMYFSNPEGSLYYTWYLKRVACNLTDDRTKARASGCDRDGDDRITVEDWKIEATKIIVQNDYDPNVNPVTSDNDNDGYKATPGGDDKAGMPNHCYLNDPVSGTNYEFGNNSAAHFTGCNENTENTLCLVGIGQMNNTALNVSASATGGTGTGGTAVPGSEAGGSGTGGSSTASGTGSVVSFTDTDKCAVASLPSCSAGVIRCAVGTAQCVSKTALPNSCGKPYTGSACTSTKGEDNSGNSCDRKHLFPNATGAKSGDGRFEFGEESFWGTNPQDPSTADNGNKDEANVVGLGQSTFAWTYDKGDQVGVAVEGTSMFSTKHNDSSFMIMWAFPKKDCKFSTGKIGSYTEDIKGYPVTVPTIDFNLNECIAYYDSSKKEFVEVGLVDPTEGGQATKMEVEVAATPNNPINSPGNEKDGDTVVAQAIVNNTSQGLENILYTWKVSIGTSIGSFNNTTSTDITDLLRSKNLLGNTSGNALDSIKLKLDIPGSDIAPYLDAATNSAYLKIQATVTENFSGGKKRTGKGSSVIKFISSGQKINAYNVAAGLVGTTTKVALNHAGADGGKICSTDPLEKAVCPIIKNKIIGLEVPNSLGEFTNFNWTINGSPLVCTARVSNECAKSLTENNVDAEKQKNINFFPVTGGPGDTYTVTVTANNEVTGKIATLTRVFNVVEPKVVLKSKTVDAWQKYLGQYKDVVGLKKNATDFTCPTVDSAGVHWCDDLSETIYQSYSGSNLNFEAVFIPKFLGNAATTKREWSVDGETKTAEGDGSIKFTADKLSPGIYNINFLAQVVQPDDIRKALLDIWGISPFESPEINFSSLVQVEVQEPLLTDGPLVGPRKYYAAIASYIPASILFTFRIFLSVVLTLFALNFLNALLEERRVAAFARSFGRSRDN